MITVFTGCYNQGEFLPEAIESVLAQTYTDFEYHLYDDGSTDNTWEIMEHYAAQDDRITATRLPKQPNKAYAMNMSIQDARNGAWVWCPADDSLLPNLLKEKKIFSDLVPYAVLYSYGNIIDGKGTKVGEFRPKVQKSDEFREQMRHSCIIGFTGVWIPTDVFWTVGGFPETEDYSEDFYWILRACRLKVEFLCVPEILYNKRKHSNCVTGRSTQEILAGVDRIRKETGWHA